MTLSLKQYGVNNSHDPEEGKGVRCSQRIKARSLVELFQSIVCHCVHAIFSRTPYRRMSASSESVRRRQRHPRRQRLDAITPPSSSLICPLSCCSCYLVKWVKSFSNLMHWCVFYMKTIVSSFYLNKQGKVRRREIKRTRMISTSTILFLA